jgi:hypothetical protein
MSDNNNVTVEVSILPDEIEMVCGEERDNNICEKRVGVVKQTEVGAMFVPVQGPTFYLGRWRLPHAPNVAAPRARCAECDKWLVADEALLLEALEKPGTSKVWAYTPPAP